MRKGKNYSLYIEDKSLQRKLDILGIIGERSNIIEKALLESVYFSDDYFSKEILPKLEEYKKKTFSKLSDLEEDKNKTRPEPEQPEPPRVEKKEHETKQTKQKQPDIKPLVWQD